jgi:hypothetical protein
MEVFMSHEQERGIIKGNLFGDFANRIKLILRLMGDRRVSPLLKLIPIGSLLYFAFPDALVFGPLAITPIDDMVILWLATYLFVELCPPAVVQEHEAALGRIVPGSARDPLAEDGEIIDAEWEEDKPS